jgi:hypothetical protein
MANIFTEQKIIDSNKRALIKYTIISDATTGNNSNVILLNASYLANALNANGYIMTSNTHPKSNYRLSIKRIFGAVHSNGYFRLKWNSASNNDIVILPQGYFDYNFESMGDGAVIPPPTNEANVTGSILYGTHGVSVNDTLTLFLDIRKDGRDYDSGQTADPTAFNRGPARFL